MPSIKSSVIALYKENQSISIDDLKKIFTDANPRTLANCLSDVRKYYSVPPPPKKIFNKVTEEEIEKVIVAKLNKSLDTASINFNRLKL